MTSNEYKIESGITAPATRINGSKYPYDKLKVGESFFVPDRTNNAMRASVAQWTRSRKSKCKFTIRILEENGVKGARVWRTA